MNNETINYLSCEQALDLVERIAERCKNFDYEMSTEEIEAMAQLLSDIGVKTSDLIDVSNLADNYAINAEIVSPENIHQYDKQSIQDALFSWEQSDGKYYCLSW
jgi:hypothetical protein